MTKARENKENLKPVEKESEVSKEIKKEKKKKSFLKKLRKFIINILILLILFTALFAAAQHPKVKPYYFEFFGLEENQEIIRLNEEIANIKETLALSSESGSKISDIKNEFTGLDRRFEVLEENNLNTIRSKADVALVLGIIERLDNVEKRISEVAKISDNGALLAMAATLVKDAADRGGSFVYEASVLEQLAKDERQIKDYVEIVQRHAKGGIQSEAFLSSEFERIYESKFASEEAAAEMEDGGDWKSRLNRKLSEIIVIKYKKANTEKEEDKKIEEQETNLDAVMLLIGSGEFRKAVRELSDPKYNDLINSDEMLKLWYYQAKARLEFFDAISKISAYSLGVMKANELR